MLLATAAFFAISCEKKTPIVAPEKIETTAPQPAVDTLAQHRADSLRADSIRRAEADAFVTYDLAFFDLHGHVKSLKLDGITYNFSKKGILTNHVDVEDEVDSFERDEKGRFFSVRNDHFFYEWGPGMRLKKEHYGNQGTIVDIVYVYNDQGQRIGERAEGVKELICGDEVLEDVEYSYSVMYSNIVRDEHGNAISYKTKDIYGDPITIKRSITYYE